MIFTLLVKKKKKKKERKKKRKSVYYVKCDWKKWNMILKIEKHNIVFKNSQVHY